MLLVECRRCKRLIPFGKKYCAECLPVAEAERLKRLDENKKRSNRKYNNSRDQKHTAFYKSKEWRLLAARRLQLDRYRCQWCGRVADEVDHIEELRTPDGWQRRLDLSNTRSLCHDCHNKRHNRFIKKKSITL